jgi:hypothetical protein
VTSAAFATVAADTIGLARITSIPAGRLIEEPKPSELDLNLSIQDSSVK